MFIFLFKWQRFCLWEQLGLRISIRKRPHAMYKDNAVGNGSSGDDRDLVFGTTARLSDLSMPLTGEVRSSPEPSARPSAAADSEERQICTTCLFVESVGLCLWLCFLPSYAMYKDNAVGNVVAETGKCLVFMTKARLSDLSMPLKGEVRRSPEQSAQQPMARSGRFVRRAYIRGERWIVKRRRSYAFSHRGAHFCLRGGWGKGGDLMWHPAVKHQRPAAKTTNSNCCDRAVAQVKQHIPEQPGCTRNWKNKYWENIEKRNQINTKNYWK